MCNEIQQDLNAFFLSFFFFFTSSFLLEYSKEVLLLEPTLGNTHRGGMRGVLRMKQD